MVVATFALPVLALPARSEQSRTAVFIGLRPQLAEASASVAAMPSGLNRSRVGL